MVEISKHGNGYLLESGLWLPRRLEELFPFYADARNLERLTPPWLSFEVLTEEEIAMRVGTRIDYRLRVRGLPLHWQSLITAWEPPLRFVDEQRRGPYRFWRHEHTFEPQAGGTLVRDRVAYGVPGGRLIHRLFVRRDVERIFTYRSRVLRELFGSEEAAAAPAA